LFLDYYSAGTAGVGDNRGTEPDQSTLVNLHALRIFILKVNVVADKYSRLDSNSAQPMKEGS
jgi:hypothetical protein